METSNTESVLPLTLTFDEVAARLDVPVLAIGQIMSDGKLHPLGIDRVNEREVDSLLATESAYLRTLR